MKHWILARQLLDGTGAPPRDAVAVGLEAGRIAEVRPLSGFSPDGENQVYDHRDSVVTPGLIDSHVHLCFDHGPDHASIRATVEGFDLPSLALLAARNAQMCLGAGITTVRDCGDRGRVTLAVRDAIRRGWIVGPRILASGTPITTTGGHLYWCGCEADDRASIRRAVRSLCKAGVDLIKVIASGGNMTTGSKPLEPQYDLAELQEAVAQAHRLGRRVATHAINAEAIRRSVAAGVDTIEHCVWQSPVGDAYDSDTAGEIVARGIWVGINMTGLDRVLLPTAEVAAAEAQRKLGVLRDRYVNARKLHELGAKVMISSDGGVRFTRFEDFYQSLVCAVQALKLSPIEAIHRATQVPADALGLGEEIGSVTVGKRADLVVVEGDPAGNISDMERVREVWMDGRPVAKGGSIILPQPVPLRIPPEFL